MSIGNDLAFPTLERSETGLGNDGQQHSTHYNAGGLTKREYFAALAMQGLSACPGLERHPSHMLAQWAVQSADDLLAELAKPATSTERSGK